MSLKGLLGLGNDNHPAGSDLVGGHFCEDPYAEQLLRSGRYCRLLREERPDAWESDVVAAATKALEREMAMVPAGSTVIEPVASLGTNVDAPPAEVEPTFEDAFFVDRYAVTNAQFERFVKADGYREVELWPEDILPFLFQFVDQTEKFGPRGWRDGEPPPQRRDHPVAGICWYEANAYALWAGKSLPTSAQWQRAGTWWKERVRYPWGNSFEPERANICCSGPGDTVPVQEYAKGATPNGIQQLIGNVWEWVYASIDHVQDGKDLFALEEPLGEIRGGAFDTYLPAQATCRFRSGQPLFFRAPNIGFRCCVAASALHLLQVGEPL
jgi:iron(II)-dependent oxidoreductase